MASTVSGNKLKTVLINKHGTLQERVESLGLAVTEAEIAAKEQKEKKGRNWETAVKIQGNNMPIHLRVVVGVKWKENVFRNALDKWIPML